MQSNQKSYNCGEIKSLVPKTPYSWLNYMIYWMVTVLLLYSNVKQRIYKFRSASCTSVNSVMRQNRSLGALPLTSILQILITWSVNMLIQKISKKQHDQWIRLEVKNLVIQMNQQDGTDCDIKILVQKTPNPQLNHMLDWMLTVLLWCRNMKLMGYKGSYAFPSQKSTTCWDETVILAMDYYLCLIFVILFENCFNNEACAFKKSMCKTN